MSTKDGGLLPSFMSLIHLPTAVNELCSVLVDRPLSLILSAHLSKACVRLTFLPPTILVMASAVNASPCSKLQFLKFSFFYHLIGSYFAFATG